MYIHCHQPFKLSIIVRVAISFCQILILASPSLTRRNLPQFLTAVHPALMAPLQLLGQSEQKHPKNLKLQRQGRNGRTLPTTNQYT